MSSSPKLRVAVVSRDPDVRMAAARAFDEAPISWDVALYESPPSGADVVVFGSDAPVMNGIEFDPENSKAIVEEISARFNTLQGEITLVTGPSRGTGATSLALHLAAGKTNDTCFVDWDLCFGAAPRLGIFGEHLTWRDTGETQESLRLAALPMAGGFRALLSPGDGEPPDDAASLLDRAASLFGRVIVDVPRGPLLDVALARCRAAVLVMGSDPVSAHRSKQLLEAHPATRWAVVVNRTGPGGETTVGALRRLIDHPIAVEIPCSAALRDSVDDGRLLTSRVWRYTRAVARLRVALEPR